MLGSGMTIKFFPLFFWKEVGLTPIQVQVIYVLAPSGIAACSLVAQRASRRFGRVQTTVATKLAGISLLVAMSRVGAGVAVACVAPRNSDPCRRSATGPRSSSCTCCARGS